MNSRRCASSRHRVKTASNWSTMTAGRPPSAPSGLAASSVSRALRSATGVAVGSSTITGPAISGATAASSLRRGSRPARSSDDLPAPEGPTSTSGSAEDSAARETRCSVTSSRPKNQRASCCSNLARPRYGVPVLLPGSRRTRCSAASHHATRTGSVSPQHFENPDQLLPVGGQMAPREVVADGADRNTGQAADVPDPQSGALPERRQLPPEIRLGFDLSSRLLCRGRIISHWSPRI